jgi:O-antigen/teichoic acid export membrane protein
MLMNVPMLNNKHFLVLLGNALLVTVSFTTSFLLFHFLSMDAVGMWFFVISLVTLCESARNGFLGTATVTFYAGTAPERAAAVMGSVWYLALALSAVILAINIIAWLFLQHAHNIEIALCIKWVGITYLSSVPIDIVCWKLQAEERYMRMFWFRMINSVTTILAFILLIMFGRMTLNNALLCNFLTNCITSLFGICLGMTGIQHVFKKTKECVFEILQYGKYMLGTTSVSVLLGNVDTWIINFMLGPAAVAVYNLAIRFMAVVELPLRTFVTTAMSEMAISFNKNNIHEVAYSFKKYTGFLTIVFIPLIISALLLADIPINLLGGAQYSHSIAANSFRLFMVMSLFYPFDRLNGLTLDVIRKTRINFYKVIIMFTVKVLGDFIGLGIFGNIYGINFSTFLVTIAAVFYGNYYLRSYISYNIHDIIVSGYRDVKLMVQKNLGLSKIEAK